MELMLRKTLIIAGVVLAAICLWLAWQQASMHHLTLRAYYYQAPNAREGIPVCVDGVEVGSVSRVTVRPELGDRPVELIMKLRTPYRLSIPGGSTAKLASRGVLGPTVVDID